jgi:peptide/nickel transport system substrate-binding protein
VRRPALAALAFLLLASACTGGSKPSPGPTDLPFARGGTLRLTLFGWSDHEFDSRTDDGKGDYALDPQNEFGPGAEILRCCLARTLMSYNGRPTAEGGALPRPDLAAADPRVSADGLTWTFRIKRGVRYAPPLQDTEVTARDFVRSLERGLSPSLFPADDVKTGFRPINGQTDYLYTIIRGATEYLQGDADTISGLEVRDEQTLQIHLIEPSGDLPYRMAMPETAPIPPSPMDPSARFGIATGHSNGFGRFQVGTGPYMIEGSQQLDFNRPPEDQQPVSGYIPGISITLVRNPSWDSSTDRLRAAYADRIEMILESGDEAHDREAADLEAGRIDIGYFVEGAADEEHERLIPKYLADPRLSKRLFIYPADFQNWLSMNLAVPPFDDVHVRKAMNFAFPKRAFQQQIDGGHVESDPASHIALDSLENNLLLDYDPYRTRNFEGDPESAKAEMRLSRYDRNRDGLCDSKVCSAVRMYFISDDPTAPTLAKLLRTSLARIGLVLDPQYLPFDEWLPHVEEPELFGAMTFSGDFKDFPNGSSFFQQFTGEPGPDQSLLGSSPEDLRRWGYDVREVPNVTERYNRCLPEVGAAQTKCWAELDQFLMETIVPWVPTTVHNRQRLVSERVARFTYAQFTTLPALDQIALKPGTRPTPYPTPVGPVPAIPDGVYRYTITPNDYVRFGVHIDNPEDLLENTGTTTITLKDGKWTSLVTSDHKYFAPINMGRYTGSGDLVTWIAERPFFNAITLPPMRWSFDGSALRFKFVSCGKLNRLEPDAPDLCESFRVAYEAHPWVKVG